MTKQQVALVSTIVCNHFVKLFDSETEAAKWAVEWAFANLATTGGLRVDRDCMAKRSPEDCLYDVGEWLGASEWLIVIPVTSAEAMKGE